MKLVGLFDSPYVRRVAVSLYRLGIDFEHAPLSVFRNMEEFSKINPLIKAPTLVTDTGTVLMDSTLILEYVETLSAQKAGESLMPSAMADYQQTLRLIGLAINACDKSVQIEYECKLRPAEKFHQPWIDRVQAQLQSAYAQIETYAQNGSGWLVGDRLTQADITVNIAWQFTHFMVPEFINGDRYPAIAALSTKAEALPEFQKCPLEAGWTAKV